MDCMALVNVIALLRVGFVIGVSNAVAGDECDEALAICERMPTVSNERVIESMSRCGCRELSVHRDFVHGAFRLRPMYRSR